MVHPRTVGNWGDGDPGGGGGAGDLGTWRPEGRRGRAGTSQILPSSDIHPVLKQFNSTSILSAADSERPGIRISTIA